MIFGESKLSRIVRAIAPESTPTARASSAMFLNFPSSIIFCQRYALAMLTRIGAASTFSESGVIICFRLPQILKTIGIVMRMFPFSKTSIFCYGFLQLRYPIQFESAWCCENRLPLRKIQCGGTPRCVLIRFRFEVPLAFGYFLHATLPSALIIQSASAARRSRMPSRRRRSGNPRR